jgi:DNA-binding transcriptional LysR family regulator
MPKTPHDLTQHRCISFSGLAAGNAWTLADGSGITEIDVIPALATNQVDAALDACLRGVGPGQFLCYQVQALIDAGKLKRVLQQFEPEPVPIQVVYPHARLLSSNVRAFVDWAVPRMRAIKLGGA